MLGREKYYLEKNHVINEKIEKTKYSMHSYIYSFLFILYYALIHSSVNSFTFEAVTSTENACNR